MSFRSACMCVLLPALDVPPARPAAAPLWVTPPLEPLFAAGVSMNYVEHTGWVSIPDVFMLNEANCLLKLVSRYESVLIFSSHSQQEIRFF